MIADKFTDIFNIGTGVGYDSKIKNFTITFQDLLDNMANRLNHKC